MLVAAIFIILVISTFAAYILRKREVYLPRVWMLMAAAGALLWLMTMVIPHDGTVRFAINNWFSTGNMKISLNIAINPINWPIVFALLTLHIAFLFVSGSRQELDQDFYFLDIGSGGNRPGVFCGHCRGSLDGHNRLDDHGYR